MSALKIGIRLLPSETHDEPQTDREKSAGVVVDSGSAGIIEAELVEINPRFCRLRLARNRFDLDAHEARIQFARTELIARLIWTNTSDDFIELGLLMPDVNSRS